MSIIRDGVFYPDEKPKHSEGNPQAKAWDRDRQRQEHAKDILQRYVGGKPNPEFIRAYGEEAKEYFTPQELKEFGNQY